MVYENWKYKATISQPGSINGDKINFPVDITIPININIMQSNVADIRFAIDETELDYFLESYDSTEAHFKVKIPNLPKSPTTTNIQIYSGNPEAVNESNPESVYEVYDKFEGTDNWINHGGASHSISNGQLVCQGDEDGAVLYKSPVQNDISFEFKVVSGNNEGYWGSSLICNDITWDNHKGYEIDLNSNDVAYLISLWNGNEIPLTSTQQVSFTPGDIVTIIRYGSSIILKKNGEILVEISDSTFLNGGYIGFRQVINRNKIIDYVKILKYTPNPPVAGSISNWELTGQGELIKSIKTIYTAIPPIKNIKTTFTVKCIKEINIRTKFCIRRVNENIKTIFSVNKDFIKDFKTIFEVKSRIVRTIFSDLKTTYEIEDNSSAKEIPIKFYVNGTYIKQLNFKGTILDSDIKDKNLRSEKQVKVIIGGNIYV